MRGVQDCELFGGITLENHAFFATNHSFYCIQLFNHIKVFNDFSIHIFLWKLSCFDAFFRIYLNAVKSLNCTFEYLQLIAKKLKKYFSSSILL